MPFNKAGRKRSNAPEEGDHITLENAEQHMSQFISYYKGIGIIPEEEWKPFMESLFEPVPVTFRIGERSRRCINPYDARPNTVSEAEVLRDFLKKEVIPKISNVEIDSEKFRMTALPWYAKEMAWKTNINMNQFITCKELQPLRDFVFAEEKLLTVFKQDITSMIPVCLVDILPEHRHDPDSRVLYHRVFLCGTASELKRQIRRGLELLELNGQLVYITRSMNPVENEAVVAAILNEAPASAAHSITASCVNREDMSMDIDGIVETKPKVEQMDTDGAAADTEPLKMEYRTPLRCDVNVCVAEIEYTEEITDAKLNTSTDVYSTTFDLPDMNISRSDHFDIKRFDATANLLEYNGGKTFPTYVYCSPNVKKLILYNKHAVDHESKNAGGMSLMKGSYTGSSDLYTGMSEAASISSLSLREEIQTHGA
ncbi:NSUN2-like protein [Mya arenaria]|uniref:NSUN2-like protein n=1 Tax=Mya arenaria TaxID=6604 RepID=A0ABY7ETG8_MYAAR|nr:NSUN2-like protein [Mya arenaria]